MKNKNKPEILAPAGSYDSLIAAIRGGADAVYIGGSKFGARAFADNLSQEGLQEAIDYAHIHNKQLYLTVNTLLKNRELEDELYSYIRPYYERGLDAVIVQDMGVLSFIRRHFPDLPVHASTQMTITGTKAALMLKDLGVTRIVTSRELSFEEIRKIKDASGLEIESFVHGALCYCYSGQCLLSSMIGGRSGNRGRCAQPCRLPYELYQDDKKISSAKEKYLLSPKDMSAIHLIPQMVEAGIDSFKIEGRMKKPEYVAAVVSTYRKYLDQYWEKPHQEYKVSEKDERTLLELYNRGGFTKGYYVSRNGPDMMSMNQPGHMGIPVGKVESIQGNKLSFVCREDIHKQDVLEIKAGREQSIVLTSPVDCKKGNKISLNGKQMRLIKPGMPIYRTKNRYLIDLIDKNLTDQEKKIPLRARVVLKKGEKSWIGITGENHTVSYEGEPVTEALKQPLTADKVQKQIMKTGNTPYEFESVVVDLEGSVFLPVYEMKELRRKGIEAYEKALLTGYARTVSEMTQDIFEKKIKNNHEYQNREELVVSIQDLSYLDLVLSKKEIAAVYIESEALDFNQWKECTKRVHDAKKEIYFMLPYIFRNELYQKEKDAFVHGEWDGYVIRSLEEFSFLIEGHTDKKLILDSNVYQYNQQAIDLYNRIGNDQTRYTFPLELNFQELNELDYPNADMIVYGYIPVMISAQCLVKNTIGCKKNTMDTYLKDRLGKQSLVRNHCKYCYNTIYNTEPLSLLNHKDEIRQLAPNRLRMHLVKETKKQAGQLLDEFIDIFKRETRQKSTLEHFTRGHFKRGIE